MEGGGRWAPNIDCELGGPEAMDIPVAPVTDGGPAVEAPM